MDEEIKQYIARYTYERESLVAKFLSETGLRPSDICLVEHETPTGRVFYPDLKSKYDVKPSATEGEGLSVLIESLAHGESKKFVEASALTALQAELDSVKRELNQAVYEKDKARYDRDNHLYEANAEIEKLKLEVEFTREYLNPKDTSFRDMMDTFRTLPDDKKDKLIALSKSLADLALNGEE
jgi:hypothetical protein